MRCTACGAEMSAGQKFCGSCGAAAAAINRCGGCGSEVAPEDKFCINCGAPRGAATAPPQPNATAVPAAPEAEDEESRRSFREEVGRVKSVALSPDFKGVGPRLVAAVIDAVLCYGASLFLLSRLGGGAHFPPSSLSDLTLDVQGMAAIVTYLAWAAYFIVFEGFLSGTPGKLILGMRVVDGRGNAPGLVPAVLRNLLRVVDVLPFFYLLGALLVSSSRERQRLGDRVAATFVVSAEGAARMRGAETGMASAPGKVPATIVLLLLLAGGAYLNSSPGNPVAKLASSVPGLSALVSTATSGSGQARPPAGSTQVPAAQQKAGQPTATAQPKTGQTSAPAGVALSQADLKGNWNGTLTLTGITVEGTTPDKKRSIEGDFAQMLGRAEKISATIEPKSADAGTLVLDATGDKSPALTYRYQNGGLAFDWDQDGQKTTFLGRTDKKGSGFVLDGTMTSVGKEGEATLKIQGAWSLSKP